MKKILLFAYLILTVFHSAPLLGQTGKKLSSKGTFQNNLSGSVGLEADNTDLFVSYSQVSGGVVGKFNRTNGASLGAVKVGGLFDLQSFGYLRRIPNTNSIFLLLPDGRLNLFDKSTGKLTLITDLNNITVKSNQIYDVQSGAVSSFSGMIQTAYATFGDFDVVVNGNTIDLFISGLSQAQTFPFLMKLRFVNGVINQAVVLASSLANGLAGNVSAVRLTRGVAVNTANSRIILTLPFSYGAGSMKDHLVSFPVSFDPTNGISTSEVPVINKSIDIQSQGMTTTTDGSIYVVTASVGSAALLAPGVPIIAVFNSSLQFMSGIKGSMTESFRDVALDPTGKTGYFSSSFNRVYTFGVTSSIAPRSDAPQELEFATVADMPTTEQSDGFSENTAQETNGFLSARREAAADLSMSPNPFSDHLVLRFTLGTAAEARFSLSSLDGKTQIALGAQYFEAGAQTQSFALPEDLPVGLYVLQVKLSDGNSFNFKTIKQ